MIVDMRAWLISRPDLPLRLMFSLPTDVVEVEPGIQHAIRGAGNYVRE